MSDFDADAITERYFSNFEDVSLINSGWCFVWAWMARVQFGIDVKLCSSFEIVTPGFRRRGHAFVSVGDLYFDAERPDGVTRHAALPAVRSVGRRRLTRTDLHPDAFRQAWDTINNHEAFLVQGLPKWPTRVPRRLRPPRSFASFERYGIGASL